MFGQGIVTEARSLLVEINTNVFRRRTVVGRAYYGAFHRVLKAAYEKGYIASNDFVHSQLIRWLSKQPNVNLQRAGVQLGSMVQKRRVADYQPNSIVSAQDAKDAVVRAENILKLIP